MVLDVTTTDDDSDFGGNDTFGAVRKEPSPTGCLVCTSHIDTLWMVIIQ